MPEIENKFSPPPFLRHKEKEVEKIVIDEGTLYRVKYRPDGLYNMFRLEEAHNDKGKPIPDPGLRGPKLFG